MYYEKPEIINGVGELSKFMTRGGITFKGKLLPHWHDLVLNSHAQMEQEINDIINLNYPHVQAVAFENLREVINQPGIKAVDKERITLITVTNNKEELASFAARDYKGFAVTINEDFLPAYFEIVDNAISNFKRIVNKYLNLYDTNKLPAAYPQPTYLPINNAPAIKDMIAKLELDITTEQLALLFRLLDEVGVLKYKQKIDMQKFLFDNIKTKTESKNFKYLTNKFSNIDNAAKTYWKDKLAEMLKLLSTKLK